jgi:Ni/Fe-hydrogenase subunit HybB-like protein
VAGNVVASSYFPTLIEVGVSAGILAYVLLAYTLGVRYLRFYSDSKSQSELEGSPKGIIDYFVLYLTKICKNS